MRGSARVFAVHELFKDVAERETRSVTIFHDAALLPDKYLFTESYCERPECDCHRAGPVPRATVPRTASG